MKRGIITGASAIGVVFVLVMSVCLGFTSQQSQMYSSGLVGPVEYDPNAEWIEFAENNTCYGPGFEGGSATTATGTTITPDTWGVAKLQGHIFGGSAPEGAFSNYPYGTIVEVATLNADESKVLACRVIIDDCGRGGTAANDKRDLDFQYAPATYLCSNGDNYQKLKYRIIAVGNGQVSQNDTLAAPSAPANANDIVKRAYGELGKPYVWGAGGPDSYDCSGLVSYCLTGQYGRVLGNTTTFRTSPHFVRITEDQAQPGDVLLNSHHTAIYIGDGKMIEAQKSGTNIMISNVAGRGLDYYRYTP